MTEAEQATKQASKPNEPFHVDAFDVLQDTANRFHAAVRDLNRLRTTSRRIENDSKGISLNVEEYEFSSEAREWQTESPEVAELGKALLRAKLSAQFEKAKALFAEIKAMELPAQ